MRPLDDKVTRLRTILREFEQGLVAFSGGVDSTLLAAFACDVLGRERVLAVTADSPSMSRTALAEARQVAAQLQLRHLVIRTDEAADPIYRQNTGARCYICKGVLFDALERLARARGINAILYGALGDDVLAERPGHRAAVEHGVRAPLQEAGLEKPDIRRLAQALGLPNWDRPQDACLASRVPRGSVVSEAKLQQVEAAEAVLRARGFRQVRVRHLDTAARIEVEPEALPRLQDEALQREIVRRFRTLGFSRVSASAYREGGADRPPNEHFLLGKGWVSGREHDVFPS